MRCLSYLYVVERYRMTRFAQRIYETACDVRERRSWTGVVGLDSVEYMQSTYENYGFKPASTKMSLYQGTVSADVARDPFGTDVRLVNIYRSYYPSVSLCAG